MKILSAIGTVSKGIGNALYSSYENNPLMSIKSIDWDKFMNENNISKDMKGEMNGYAKQYVFTRDENEIKKTHDENGNLIKDDANKFVDGLTQKVSPVFDDNPNLGTTGRDR